MTDREIEMKRAAERAADPQFLAALMDVLLYSGVHEAKHTPTKVFAQRGVHYGEVSAERIRKGFLALVENGPRWSRGYVEALLWNENDRISGEAAAHAWLASFPRTPSARVELGHTRVERQVRV
jgi:hypothetical protein